MVRDFVECALYNNDSLPLGPFTWKHPAAEAKPGLPLAVAKKPPGKRIQSPPMGFNSWNFYHCNIDENTVKAVIDTIADGPLKAAGYEYVNIDDCWQALPR